MADFSTSINHHSDRNSLTERVIRQIVEYIQNNDLQPGDRLPNEQQLSQSLSVGRGTLREAVKSLAARNILEVRHGSGTYISEKPGIVQDPLGLAFVSDKAALVKDLLMIRSLLEPTIAGLAAHHANDEEIERLRFLCREMEGNVHNREYFLQMDIEFHTLIAKCSRNSVVPNLLPTIHNSITIFNQVNFFSQDEFFWQDTIKTHNQICWAIAEHDPMAAEHAMLVHLARNDPKLKP